MADLPDASDETRTDKPPRRRRWIPLSLRLFAAFLVLIGLSSALWLATEAYSLRRYNLQSRRINDTICTLRERKPPNVSEKLWEDCVAWASIAHCNVCFSESHTKYTAMLEYEKDLDDKLKGPVDLGTMKWIGERLEKTGPHGQQYFVKVNWWQQWEATLRAKVD